MRKPKYAGYSNWKSKDQPVDLWRSQPSNWKGLSNPQGRNWSIPSRSKHNYFVWRYGMWSVMWQIQNRCLGSVRTMDTSQNFQKKCWKRLIRFQMHRLLWFRGTVRSARWDHLYDWWADAKTLDDSPYQATKNGNLSWVFTHRRCFLVVARRYSTDKEALNRATSVYVTDRVVPMLPERSSPGLGFVL